MIKAPNQMVSIFPSQIYFGVVANVRANNSMLNSHWSTHDFVHIKVHVIGQFKHFFSHFQRENSIKPKTKSIQTRIKEGRKNIQTRNKQRGSPNIWLKSSKYNHFKLRKPLIANSLLGMFVCVIKHTIELNTREFRVKWALPKDD